MNTKGIGMKRNIAILFLLSVLGACSESGTSDSGQAAGSGVEAAKGERELSERNGVLYFHDAPLNGNLVERYEDGSLKSVTPYRNGKEEGKAEGWYPDGSKMEERFYKEGKKVGTHRGWWEDGTPQFEYHFADGLHEGSLQEWYADGTLFRSFNYVEGEEEGEQKMWNNDGTLKANYVVLDGRRYGSLGVKPCRTTESAEPETTM